MARINKRVGYRSAISGRFVTRSYSVGHPASTVKVTFKTKGKK
ncbi:MAG TPA: hypothetical protein PLM81_11685 [Ginsengibacter sp.]|nr:hypothetical protein [Ginsengibacter sp.]